MKTITDIMTNDVVTLAESDTLKQGRRLMRDLDIRHIPILSDQNQNLVGVLTERIVLSKVFELISLHGSKDWKPYEDAIKIKNIMIKEIAAAEPHMPLHAAAQHFVDHKHGCLPIVEDNKVVGIITSSDFVDLALDWLKDNEND